MEVAEAVAAFPEVYYLVVTAGSYDILMEVVCEDNDALLRFLTERLRRVDGRPRDGDVRLPADGQAGLRLGHAVGSGQRRPRGWYGVDSLAPSQVR